VVQVAKSCALQRATARVNVFLVLVSARAALVVLRVRLHSANVTAPTRSVNAPIMYASVLKVTPVITARRKCVLEMATAMVQASALILAFANATRDLPANHA